MWIGWCATCILLSLHNINNAVIGDMNQLMYCKDLAKFTTQQRLITCCCFAEILPSCRIMRKADVEMMNSGYGARSCQGHMIREYVTCCYVAGTLLSLHNMNKIAQPMLGSYCIARLLLSFLVGQSDGVASQWLCHVCTGWTNLQTRQQLDDVLKECWWVSATWENVQGKRWTLSCIDMVETAKGLFAVPIPCKNAARFGQKKKAC